MALLHNTVCLFILLTHQFVLGASVVKQAVTCECIWGRINRVQGKERGYDTAAGGEYFNFYEHHRAGSHWEGGGGEERCVDPNMPQHMKRPG